MLTSPLQRVAAPRRRPGRWLLALLLAYAIVGFLILPPIVRLIAVKQFRRQLDRDVSIQSVRLNPFVLSATIRGLQIKDPDGQPFASWDELYANFQLSSFLGHPWVFKEIHLTRPFLRAQLNPDGSLNFSDLIAKFSTGKVPAPSPSRPSALRVKFLRISGATALLTDLTPHTPFHRLAGPLDISLTNFRTDPGNPNPYGFSGTTEAGEKVAWNGSFSLDPLRLQGDFSLENLALNKYEPLYQDLVRFKIRDGVLGLRAGFQLQLGASNLLATLTNASLTLRDFKLGEPGNETNLVELSELAVRGVHVDLGARTAEAEAIHLDGARLSLERNAADGLNLANLARPAESASAPGGVLLLLRSITNAVEEILTSTNAWRASLRQADLQNASVHFVDLAPARPVSLDLENIQLQAADLSNIPGSNWTARLSFRSNTNSSFQADARASLNPPSADVRLAVDHLDLHPLGAYLEPWLNIVFLQSELGLTGTFQLQAGNTSLPHVSFQGEIGLDHLSTVDGALGEELFSWSSLRISGIDASLNPPIVQIQAIQLNDAAARVLVESNRTINLLAALRPANAPPALPAAPRPLPAQTPPASPSTDAAAELAPQILIQTITLSNAAIHFVDRSVTPPVRTSIEPIQGTLSELSSETLGHAVLDLEAHIDTVGRARILGTINPFSRQKSNELSIKVEDVDLLAVSPYAGKFAGYRIARGKLGLDLAYHLRGRNLRAENQITLDHFTFGEHVDSPEATSLPVRLGVAILKDRHGRIQLDVPVDGSLDDPDFRIHKVVMHTLVNLLTRAATSPFALLGSVFGGRGEEVRYQAFAPGSSELIPSEKSKLDALAHGLFERPGLQIEIQGSVDPIQDRDGLRLRQLDAHLRSAYWASLNKTARAETSPDRLTLTPEERAHWVKKLYAKALDQGQISSPGSSGQGSAAAAAPPALYQSTEPLHGATRLMRPETQTLAAPVPSTSLTVAADPFEQALLNSIAITDAEFETLASNRASAVRDYLVQSGKVEPDRVYLAETKAEGLNTDGARTSVQFR